MQADTTHPQCRSWHASTLFSVQHVRRPTLEPTGGGASPSCPQTVLPQRAHTHVGIYLAATMGCLACDHISNIPPLHLTRTRTMSTVPSPLDVPSQREIYAATERVGRTPRQLIIISTYLTGLRTVCRLTQHTHSVALGTLPHSSPYNMCAARLWSQLEAALPHHARRRCSPSARTHT